MKPLKPHLSLSEQVALLKERGLIINDDSEAERILFNVNYYRLSGYLHNFKDPKSGRYIDQLSLEKLKRIYDFDRKFTRILLFALEDVEETFKTRLSYIITRDNPTNPEIYLDLAIYKDPAKHAKFCSHFNTAKVNNKKLPFIEHHNKEYGGHLPMWVAVELLTMGNLHAVYDNLITKYQKVLAKSYDTGPRQLSNWLQNLTYTRNHLAHYMRIYNFNFGRTPSSCKNHPKTFLPSNMIFDQLFIISCMYSDKLEWNNYVLPEIRAIIDEYSSEINLSGLGFPDHWESALEKT